MAGCGKGNCLFGGRVAQKLTHLKLSFGHKLMMTRKNSDCLKDGLGQHSVGARLSNRSQPSFVVNKRAFSLERRILLLYFPKLPPL